MNAVVCAIKNLRVDDTGAVINAVCLLNTRVIVCVASDCSVAITFARIPATAVIVKDVGKSVSVFDVRIIGHTIHAPVSTLVRIKYHCHSIV